MPEVVIVGGGIIGAACAHELTLRGFAVTLFEAHELAHGASGRNLGLVDLPKDPVLDPLARSSIERYLDAAADPPFPFFIDREPIGTLAVALEGAALREAEPGLTREAKVAWRFHEGHRVDPGGLTICLAELARRPGATVHHHTPVRRLIVDGDRVTGVVTDDGMAPADIVVLAAGPWSAALVRPLGVQLRIAGARGWMVQMAPSSPPIRHWIEGGARAMWRMEMRPVSARSFADGDVPFDVGSMIQPAPDGTVIAGTSREAAILGGDGGPGGRDARGRAAADRSGAVRPAAVRLSLSPSRGARGARGSRACGRSGARAGRCGRGRPSSWP